MDRVVDFAERSPRRFKRLLGLFVLSMLVPPLVMSLMWILPGAIAVIQTGNCPAAAPDVPSYPCALGEYLLRMTVGPLALLGHLMNWFSWIVVNLFLWGLGLFGIAFYRNLRSGN